MMIKRIIVILATGCMSAFSVAPAGISFPGDVLSRDQLSPALCLQAKDVRSAFHHRISDLNDRPVVLFQSNATLKGYPRKIPLAKNLSNRLEQSGRIFLPYDEILTAVNILFFHEKMKDIYNVEVDFEATDDRAEFKEGTLVLAFQNPGQLKTADVLKIFQEGLHIDLAPIISKIERAAPQHLLNSGDFDAINIILHERLAGLGDLVFVGNAAQIFARMFPHKTIRLIFHSQDDVQLFCSTKILKGLGPETFQQETGGITVINASLWGREKNIVSSEGMSIKEQPWYKAQAELIGENDIALIYALGGEVKDIMHDTRLAYFSGNAKNVIRLHELGFSSLYRDPAKSGNAHLGFGKNEIGLSPVSPVTESLYLNKDPRDRQERDRVLQKIPGWQKLPKNLAQTDWGFLYVHQANSIKKYFENFEAAREAVADVKAKDATFFVMCGKTDKEVQQAVAELCENNNYGLFVYSHESQTVSLQRASENNVTVILDYSVPRKLFSELFLYSNDLPTLVSGQDNLANVIYLNVLTSGRPFFWEVLTFQETAKLDIYGYIEDQWGKDAFKELKNIWDFGEKGVQLFSDVEAGRHFFNRLATTLNEHPSFLPQIYYLMLRQTENSNHIARKKADVMIQTLGPRPEREKIPVLSGYTAILQSI